MTCPYAETTTLLWVHGEGDPEHVDHVAECAECQEVVALHADVAALVQPIAPALARDTGEEGAHESGAEGQGAGAHGGDAVSPWSRVGPMLGGLGALAAAALLAITLMPSSVGVSQDTAVAMAAEVPSAEHIFDDELDGQLDALDDELDALSLDMTNL